jgi:hypothetical protein
VLLKQQQMKTRHRCATSFFSSLKNFQNMTQDISYAPKAVVKRPAPDFETTAVINQEFKKVRLSKYQGNII